MLRHSSIKDSQFLLHKMKTIFTLAIGLVVWSVVSIFLIPLAFILLLWKFTSLLYLHLIVKNPSNYEPLNVLDCLPTLSPESNLPCCPIYLERRIELEEFREYISKIFFQDESKYRVLRYTMRQVFGYGYKELLPTPDLNHHISERLLKKGESEDVVIQEIIRDSKKLATFLFPCWEFVLVQGRKRTVIVFKISHWLVDGHCHRFLLDALFQRKEEYRIPEGGKPVNVLRMAWIILQFPANFLLRCWGFLLRCWGTRFNSLPSGRIDHPWLGEIADNSLPYNELVFSFCTLDFREVKALSKKTGWKIMAILLSLHFSAMRSLLKLRGRLRTDTGNLLKLDTHFTLPAPRHPLVYEGKCGNHMILEWTQISLPLTEEDLWHQTDVINRQLNSVIESQVGLSLFWLIWSSTLTPRVLVLAIMKLVLNKDDVLSTIFPMVLSEKDEKLFICGARVERIYTVSPASGLLESRETQLIPLTRGSKLELGLIGQSDIFQSNRDAELYWMFYKKSLAALLETSGSQ